MKKYLFYLWCMLALSCVLIGCGRTSSPEQPAGSFYPHTYIVK